jgi:hypothetical protein
MTFKMGEHKRIAVKRQIIAIMQSPQGRDFGRIFLEELGKETAGDLGGAIDATLDVFAEVFRELYASEKPIQSR